MWGACLAISVVLLEALANGKASLIRNLPSMLSMYTDVLSGRARLMTVWSVTRGCWINIVMQFFGDRESAMSIAQRHRKEHETVAIVTGATGGIGVTTTEALMSAGVHVILAVRDQARGEALLARLLSAGPGRKGTVLPLNVADLKSVNSFVDKFQALGCPLHLLVNNAGVMALPNFKPSPDGVEMQFATNYLGHFHLTGLLLPLLEQSGRLEDPSRIVNVSSSMHSFMSSFQADAAKCKSPDEYSPLGQYAVSKASQILFTVDLNRRLQDKAVRAFAVHPGVIPTNLLSDSAGVAAALDNVLFHNVIFKSMLKTVEQGASTTVYAALDPAAVTALAAGACYFSCNAPCPCTAAACDPIDAATLWTLSEDMVKAALATKTDGASSS